MTPAGSAAPASTPSPGAVAGAKFNAPAKASASKPAGGVLGATARAGKSLGATATRGTLPFTGLPLWIAALIGMTLLTGGLVLRRSGTSSNRTL